MKKIFVCVFINYYIRFSLSEFMLRRMQSYTETLDQKKSIKHKDTHTDFNPTNCTNCS